MPESRDHSPAAKVAFAAPVPTQLMSYLAAHKDGLLPEIRSLWESTGFKESGTWTEVFGDSPWTDEVFMAWHMASYVGAVARAPPNPASSASPSTATTDAAHRRYPWGHPAPCGTETSRSPP